MIVTNSFILLLALIVAGCNQPAPPQPKHVNQKPSISAINGPKELIPGGEGEFYCVAYDPDGAITDFLWSCDQGTFKNQGEKVTFVAPDKLGRYMITVNVRDNEGAYAMSAKELKVTETAGAYTGEDPIVLKIKLGDADSATDNKRVRIWFSALIECAVEGNPQGVTYTWTSSGGTLQGKGLAEGAAGKVAWIAPGSAGDYRVSVAVKDQAGNTGSGVVYFKVFCCGN